MGINQQMDSAIERACGFDKYNEIMNTFMNVDVSNEDFQKLYNEYYKVRRNGKWRKVYFNCFEHYKNTNNPNFNDIIDYLFNNCVGNKNTKDPVEASFASKMLATINDKKPILDSKVLEKMNLEIKEGKTKVDKLRNAKDIYAEIERRYRAYIGTPDCLKAIKLFDSYFPDYTHISSVKKIDWFLFSMERNELIALDCFGGLI